MIANELRIGNYVYDRGCKILRIDFFEHLQVGHDCKFGMINKLSDDWGPLHPLTEYTDYAKPIPLTPEILGKIKMAKKVKDGWFAFEFTPPICYYWRESNKGFRMGGYNLCTINYLHELQNAIYSLTGHELEIEL